MQKIVSEVILRTGNKIPKIGFGTYQISGDSCYESVSEALKCGYRHIDSATVYKNEGPTIKAIENSKIRREEIYITSKIGPLEMGYEKTKKAF